MLKKLFSNKWIISAVAAVTATFAYAAWDPDTLRFNPQSVIKETAIVVDKLFIKGNSNSILFEKLNNGSMYARLGFARLQQVADPTTGTDAMNKRTFDNFKNNLKLPTRSSNPGSPSEGLMYWNTTVDSLRVYDGSTFRNIGMRGDGYFDTETTNDPRVRRNVLSSGQYVYGSYLAGTLRIWSHEQTAEKYCNLFSLSGTVNARTSKVISYTSASLGFNATLSSWNRERNSGFGRDNQIWTGHQSSRYISNITCDYIYNHG